MPLRKGLHLLISETILKEKIREFLGDGVQSSISLENFEVFVFLLGEVRKQGGRTRLVRCPQRSNALLSCGALRRPEVCVKYS